MDRNGYYNEAFQYDIDEIKHITNNNDSNSNVTIINVSMKNPNECYIDIKKDKLRNDLIIENANNLINMNGFGPVQNKTNDKTKSVVQNSVKLNGINEQNIQEQFDVEERILQYKNDVEEINYNLFTVNGSNIDKNTINKNHTDSENDLHLEKTETDSNKTSEDGKISSIEVNKVSEDDKIPSAQVNEIFNTVIRQESEEFYVNKAIDDYLNDNEKNEIANDFEGDDSSFRNRLKGKAFSSFREPGSLSWRGCRSCRQFEDLDIIRKESSEVNRSQYSLVSCGELTSGAVQLWLGLPEEVKYDPALAPFRQIYEKELQGAEKSENGVQQRKGPPKVSRLPLVNSAPHLMNNNLQTNEKKEKLMPAGIKEEVTESAGASGDHIAVRTKASKVRHYAKMAVILAAWVFFTTVFLLYDEREEIIRNTFLSPGVNKTYPLNVTAATARVEVRLRGPFMSADDQDEILKVRGHLHDMRVVKVWLSKYKKVNTTKSRTEWRFINPVCQMMLVDNQNLDFNVGEERSAVVTLDAEEGQVEVALMMETTSNETVPFTMEYTLEPWYTETGVACAIGLLVALYVFIIFEIVNRTMAAILISTSALAVLAIAGQRPSVEELVSWLDFETLVLLFSMMILVSIMAETGMFDYLAVYTFQVTKGKLWPLITLLCAITASMSTVLDNVTTVLLMTPVTIRLCEVMGLDPVPILMSMVIFSNVGGTATPVGDPPNVIIASNKEVVKSGINFTVFTLHMTMGIILVIFQTYFQLRFMFRDTNKLRIREPSDIQELRHQISIWRRAADSLPHLSKDVNVVRERLERKVSKLSTQLDSMVKESSKRACPKATFQSTLDEMKLKYKIKDKPLLIKSSIAMVFVVTIFFLHALPELNRVTLGWTALLGAILLLVLADREDLEPILHRVEWSTLLFFAALFVFMEALSKLGLIDYIGQLTENLILKVDPEYQLAVALILLLWITGITSAFVDNVPLATMMVRIVTTMANSGELSLPLQPLIWALTYGVCLGGLSSAFVDNIPLATMMVRVVTSLANRGSLDLPLQPLIWALAFGACLGGNGTLIGASANVVCAGVAEQHGYKFSFLEFFKLGFPIMIGHLICATIYLMLCHVAFEWH